MRRFALLLPICLAGCGYVGNPYDGFAGFIGDTVTINTNPNRPVGDAANLRRSVGTEVEAEPLLPETGNIWPGPLPPARTLSDLQRDPEPAQGDPVPRGSTTPPAGQPMPAPYRPIPMPQGNAAPPATPPSAGRILQTPGGPITTTIGGNGVETFRQPTGRNGVVINNGNGTSTLIGTDGSSVTVPSAR